MPQVSPKALYYFLCVILEPLQSSTTIASVFVMITHIHTCTLCCSRSVFFESVTWDETEVGFEEVPGGEQYANRSVLSYHFYKPPQVSVCMCNVHTSVIAASGTEHVYVY